MVLNLKKKPVPQEIDRQRTKVIRDFIGVESPVLIIGSENNFDECIVRMYDTDYSFTEGNLNWGSWHAGFHKYNTVFCFDVLEHLINPGFFLNELKPYLTTDSDIYITFPTRPSVRYWSTTHFHEYDRDRFETLVDLCGYRIVKEQHVVLHRDWKFYFGFRPLVRLFFQKYTYNLYLIRQK